LEQAQVGEPAEEEQRRQQGEREQEERLADLADEGERDHRAGNGAQVQRRAAVCVGDGGRAGGLQGEVLGGQGLEEPRWVDPGGTRSGALGSADPQS
jgi:hypothetical protein